MDKKSFLIILGTAHLATTPGKCAPDKSIREAFYSRDRINAIYTRLKALGYNVTIDYPDLQPVARIKSTSAKTEQSRELIYRCEIVNNLCRKWGPSNCLYLSLHINAAGSGGKWLKAGGWSVYTSVGKTKADILAEHLYDAAAVELAHYAAMMEEGKKSGAYDSKQRPFRTDKTDGDRDQEANFYVLRKTICPAVLTENLFQDNRSDVAFLLSDEGKKAIENLHIAGIRSYIDAL